LKAQLAREFSVLVPSPISANRASRLIARSFCAHRNYRNWHTCWWNAEARNKLWSFTGEDSGAHPRDSKSQS